MRPAGLLGNKLFLELGHNLSELGSGTKPGFTPGRDGVEGQRILCLLLA